MTLLIIHHGKPLKSIVITRGTYSSVVVDHLDPLPLGRHHSGADGHIEFALRRRFDPDIVTLSSKKKHTSNH